MEWYQGWDQEYRTRYTPVLDLSRNPKCGSTLYSIWNCRFQVVIYSRFRTHLYISVNAYYMSQYTLIANLEQQCWIYARHVYDRGTQRPTQPPAHERQHDRVVVPVAITLQHRRSDRSWDQQCYWIAIESPPEHPIHFIDLPKQIPTNVFIPERPWVCCWPLRVCR